MIKKIQIAIVALLIVFLVSCGKIAHTTSLSQMTVTDYAGFMVEISPSQDMLDLINSSVRKIAYIDDDLLIFYDPNHTNFDVYENGEVKEFNEGPPYIYKTKIIVGYDSDDDKIYYYDQNTSSFYLGSEFIRYKNTFFSYRRDILFDSEDQVLYPYQSLTLGNIRTSENSKFYTIHNEPEGAYKTCTINSFDDFSGTPVDTFTFADHQYCGDNTVTDYGQVIIPITNPSGLAVIHPDGTISTILYSESLPELQYMVKNSLHAFSQEVFYFKYENTDGTQHMMAMDYSLTNKFDTTSNYIYNQIGYIDQDYIVAKEQKTSDFILYDRDMNAIYSFDRRNDQDTYTYTEIHRYGDHFIYFERDGSYTPKSRIITYDTQTGEEHVYDLESVYYQMFLKNYYIYTIDNTIMILNLLDNSIINTGVIGSAKIVNNNTILLVSDDVIYIYNLSTNQYIETKNIGRYKTIYDTVPNYFLVQFNGSYYIIG